MLNKIVVSAYKLSGFVILVGILVGLASYVALSIFYFASSSWVAPVIVAPSDKRVLELNAQYAAQLSLRDTLVAQRAEMVGKLHDSERIADAEGEYQDALRASLRQDLEDRRVSMSRLASLRAQYVSTSGTIAAANDEFAGVSKDRMKEMFDAHLATKDEILRANMEFAGLANANLSLEQGKSSLEDQIFTVRRQVESIELVESLLLPSAAKAGGARVAFASGDAPGAAPPTHDVLAVQREFELSVLAMKRANDEATSIKAAIKAADATLERYEALLGSIKDSPYLKAVDKNLMIAFVPYTNVDAAKAGTPVYACKGNIVWCKRVGLVRERLEGEVAGQNPLQHVDLRGVFVRLELSEARAAEEPVLHLGRAPLFF